MNHEITMGSLFDGIGGFPLAAVHCGVKPLWASEIETFPIEVTKERFPDMVHVGDITKLNGTELPPVDIICGGQPLPGPFRCRRQSWLVRLQIRPVYGANPNYKGDEKCRYTSWTIRYLCSTQIPVLGKRPRCILQRGAERRGLSNRSRRDRPN